MATTKRYWKAGEYEVKHPPADTWCRSCPQCGAYLKKRHLLDVLYCVCGWVWGK